ncbi:MAG: hypothetical protein AB8H03_18505 [Saprospiraceae bacterium]
MYKTSLSFIGFLFVILLLSSCKDDDNDPILLDSQVKISNTLQTAADPSMGGTGGIETPIEVILGVPAGTFEISTTVNSAIEFNDYLDGLYDIDLSENQISYNLVAPADHPIYANFFRTIEANTFDRYYFKFTENHNIESSTSNNSSVSLTIISSDEVLVEIGEGFNFNPGSSFIIDLN